MTDQAPGKSSFNGGLFAGTRGDVGQRLEALSAAINASRGRIDDDILDPPSELAERASGRLLLSGEHTIVALAGATGSGKSSLFNALTDMELAGVGVRRPTTSWALACAWGPDGAGELLAWMGIPARHQISRTSMLDHAAEGDELQGLVLIDLPDHDSTEVAHHLEMDRLVEYADVLVWVLDPQKYADAAIHDRYLRPLASYRDVTIVVLNQIDRIDYTERGQALEDVRRILDSEGLEGVTLLGASASRGDGVDAIKQELSSRIQAKRSARDRLGADIDAAAAAIVAIGGSSDVPGIADVDREHLDGVLESAAGIDQTVRAIKINTRRRGGRLTGWLPVRWLVRRPKPLGDPNESSSSLQLAQAEAAIRDFAETASVGLDGPWREAVRRVSAGRTSQVVPHLDSAVSSAGVAASRTPVWWYLANVVQWTAFVSLVVGGVWWAGYGVVKTAHLSSAAPIAFAGYDLPVILTVGGAVTGIGLGLFAGIVNRIAGVRRSRHAERVLKSTIDGVAEKHIVAPVRAELAAYETYRTNIIRARS